VLFNSAEFLLCFLPLVLVVYYRLPHRAQNAFLVLASCVFYASWDWRFLFPLLCTTSIDYFCARRMEESVARGEPTAARKKFLLYSCVTNLSLLAFFKYFNFFSSSLRDLFLLFGFDAPLRTYEIVLPIGISFFTFQALSYTIDVFRGELHATRSFWDFFLAVLYFPHLVAGPIQRAADLLPQVTEPRTIRRAQVEEGVHLFFWGFFKKVYIADNLAPIANACFADSSPGFGTTVLGVYAFTFQIYGDFSGYTDIARGIAKVMGFDFVLNFNLPYFATNPSDFWRRWHISLSSWLRDYLYKSLGGNRRGAMRTQLNLMLTMVLGGLWHGAAWNFVLWGFYHGGLLVVHRVATPGLEWIGRTIFRGLDRAWLGARIAVMFLFTCYGWLLFRATSLRQVRQMTHSLFQPAAIDWTRMRQVSVLILPLVVVQLVQHRTGDLFFLRRIPIAGRVVVYSVLVYFMLFLGGDPQAFVYFQF
jgi:alginate O-acetyltransferase complex protein AlgI